jgi:hypothetical protein
MSSRADRSVAAYVEPLGLVAVCVAVTSKGPEIRTTAPP